MTKFDLAYIDYEDVMNILIEDKTISYKALIKKTSTN